MARPTPGAVGVAVDALLEVAGTTEGGDTASLVAAIVLELRRRGELHNGFSDVLAAASLLGFHPGITAAGAWSIEEHTTHTGQIRCSARRRDFSPSPRILAAVDRIEYTQGTYFYHIQFSSFPCQPQVPTSRIPTLTAALTTADQVLRDHGFILAGPSEIPGVLGLTPLPSSRG